MYLKIKLLLIIFLMTISLSYAKENEGIVSIDIDLNAYKDSQEAKVWIPYPVSDEYQQIEDVQIDGNFTNSEIYGKPEDGSVYLFAEWQGKQDEKFLKLSFKAKAEERIEKDLIGSQEFLPKDIEPYLQPNFWIITDGDVKKLADEIVKDREGVLAKAKSIYDWMVENTVRDPNVKGCGIGKAAETLSNLSGKCADLSSLYISLARSVGVPAREVFGLRLGNKEKTDMTGGYHCWVEFYLPGRGWIPTDPADVRKIMLVENFDLEQASAYIDYYFGAVDENRIILNRGGRNITLQPEQKSGPLNYLMYPYAEIDGQALDYFHAKDFIYSVKYTSI